MRQSFDRTHILRLIANLSPYFIRRKVMKYENKIQPGGILHRFFPFEQTFSTNQFEYSHEVFLGSRKQDFRFIQDQPLLCPMNAIAAGELTFQFEISAFVFSQFTVMRKLRVCETRVNMSVDGSKNFHNNNYSKF